MSSTLTDPSAYAAVYQQHLPLIQSIIRRSGCPVRLLEDVTSEVVTAIVASDGLAKYDSSKASMRTYLARYVSQAAWTILRRIRAQESHQAPILYDFDSGPRPSSDPLAFETFLEDLLDACPDDDCRTFVLVATTCLTYAATRQELVRMGWESNRIRRTVKSTRAILR